MIATSLRARRLGVVAMSLIGLVVLAGCTAAPSGPVADRSAEPSSSALPQASPAASGDANDVLAERDAFFADQKFPVDGTPPRATTAAQKELVQRQREWVESKGGTWSAGDEGVLLAMGSDICETGILNGHEIDADLLKQTVVSSPLLPDLTGVADPQKKAMYERNFASGSVFSASYLCPADNKAWEAAFAEAYPG